MLNQEKQRLSKHHPLHSEPKGTCIQEASVLSVFIIEPIEREVSPLVQFSD